MFKKKEHTKTTRFARQGVHYSCTRVAYNAQGAVGAGFKMLLNSLRSLSKSKTW